VQALKRAEEPVGIARVEAHPVVANVVERGAVAVRASELDARPLPRARVLPRVAEEVL
jgi:hypothetical protein